MSDLILSALSMTSREIAELTGKHHKNVLRDIDNLLNSLGSELSRGISEAYEGDPSHGYRYFILDRDSTYCLIAGYDAPSRMKIIKRWQALESGQATPAFRLEPKDTPPTRRRTDIPPVAALRLSPLAMQAAKAFGFAGNMAALAADRAIREITGLSPLKLLGHEHLEADPRGKTYTQTELGQMMDPPRSGIAVGKLMADAGLRAKDETGEWIPTAAANGLYEWSDTAKRHNGGTPVKQAKWFREVLSRLNGGAQ